VRHIVVPVDGESELLDSDLGLSDYQGLVGGWIEHVYLPDHDVIAVVNEEGVPQGLHMNTRATSVVSACLGRAQPLFGTVVFVGNGDDGDEADIPDDFVETWMHLLQ
jgi:hypothetical protein